MATIVNNPPAYEDRGGNGMGFLLGVIVLLFVAALFFYYGLPLIGQAMQGPQVNVPGKIDVNVNTPNK